MDFDFNAWKISHNKHTQESAQEETERRRGWYRGLLRNWLLRKETGKPTQPDPKPEPPRSQIAMFDEFGLAYVLEGPTLPDESPADDPVVGQLGQPFQLLDGREAYSRGPNDNAPLGYVIEKDGFQWRKELARWSNWLPPTPFYVKVA